MESNEKIQENLEKPWKSSAQGPHEGLEDVNGLRGHQRSQWALEVPRSKAFTDSRIHGSTNACCVHAGIPGHPRHPNSRIHEFMNPKQIRFYDQITFFSKMFVAPLVSRSPAPLPGISGSRRTFLDLGNRPGLPQAAGRPPTSKK